MDPHRSSPICGRNGSPYLMMLKQELCQNEMPQTQTHFIMGCLHTLEGAKQMLLSGVMSINPARDCSVLSGDLWSHLR